jgi:O-antigen ligase
LKPGTSRPSQLLALFTAVWTIVFFSNLPAYMGLFLYPGIQPVHWVGLFIASTAPLLLQPQTRRLGLPRGIMFWCAGYAALCIVWYAAFGGGDPQILRQRLLAIAFLAFTTFLFVQSERSVIAARIAIAVAVVIAVLLNVYDLTHPFYFVPAYSEFALLGRAAGIYANPNSAGAALVLGFVLTVGIVPARLRMAYIVLVSAGVVMTLSRGAMLGFVLATLLLFVAGEIRGRSVASAALAGAVLGWVAWAFVLPVIASDFKLDPAIIIDRILWLLDPGTRSDFSQVERVELAEKGWLQFVASPWFGNGVGSTELWEARSSTHNVYLMLMSDFGWIGVLVLPALALAAAQGQNAAGRRCRVAFVAFLLLHGTLSHNLLTDLFLLVTIALLAAMLHAGTPPDIRWNAPAGGREEGDASTDRGADEIRAADRGTAA